MPVFNPNTPELREFLIMASADTRNLIQQTEANAATILANKIAQDAANESNALLVAAAQLAADTANSSVEAVQATTTELSGEMVINEAFTLPLNAFTLQASGLYHAILDLIKVDGSKGVQMSLIDNDGDEQGFSQLMANYGGDTQKVAVELTANQKNDSSYPLALLCQGRKLAAMVAASVFKQLGNSTHWYKLSAGKLDYSFDGATVSNTIWESGVVSAFMLTSESSLYFALDNGQYYFFDSANGPASWITTNQSVFDSKSNLSDRIAL
jgi:hypothetical protein